ncbi:GNAT family N-acetyltransferase [Sphingomonas spermidinifaciens]|uniref:GNAT family N-acetyltransferase n=1 Tax=Sphingomonas spermidinifaciens TaxID=1141889 RepID=A0A2A4B1N8_9SPHN|nr:GNAT family N-acetyltransferase [Sphingomonas spermidinifaciens]PCD02361.1 GNAT family N-acetyltransferase [Sphingomonas spermidinifaciens]
MTTGPVLFTPRLLLRLPEPQDFDGWAAMCADPDTMRFLGGAMVREAAWRDFALRRGAWDVRGFSMFSVIERATGAWVGRIGPWQPEGWPGTEVGWGVHPAFAGRGYAHEAAVACMDYAVDVLGWADVIHTIDPANTRSIALAERLGSRDRGPVRLPAPLAHFTVHAWGQRAGEWRARRA